MFPGLCLSLSPGLKNLGVTLRSLPSQPYLCMATNSLHPQLVWDASSPLFLPLCLTQPHSRSAPMTKPGTCSILTAEPCK